MKKTYRKPTLVRHSELTRVTGGVVKIGSPGDDS
jgi:hypothetical protein